jgi:hypothetical protein
MRQVDDVVCNEKRNHRLSYCVSASVNCLEPSECHAASRSFRIVHSIHINIMFTSHAARQRRITWGKGALPV